MVTPTVEELSSCRMTRLPPRQKGRPVPVDAPIPCHLSTSIPPRPGLKSSKPLKSSGTVRTAIPSISELPLPLRALVLDDMDDPIPADPEATSSLIPRPRRLLALVRQRWRTTITVMRMVTRMPRRRVMQSRDMVIRTVKRMDMITITTMGLEVKRVRTAVMVIRTGR
jgi:hypothetical protein